MKPYHIDDIGLVVSGPHILMSFLFVSGVSSFSTPSSTTSPVLTLLGPFRARYPSTPFSSSPLAYARSFPPFRRIPKLPPSSGASFSKCVPLTLPMCRGIGYNLTYSPNGLGHETQAEAGLEAHQFWPLVQIGCAAELRLFLCVTYAPICLRDYLRPLPACRGVCERSRAGCEPLMLRYGFAWPERMACDNLPEFGGEGEDGVCVRFDAQPGDVNGAAAAGRRAPATPVLEDAARSQSKSVSWTTMPRGAGWGERNLDYDVTMPGDSSDGRMGNKCGCHCPPPFVRIAKLGNGSHVAVRSLITAADGVEIRCAMPCDGVLSSREEKEFAMVWLGVWSVVSLVSTTMTLVLVVVDGRKVDYPGRLLVYAVACYSLVDVGYLVRLLVGHDVIACESYGELMVIRSDSFKMAALSNDVSSSLSCIIVFILIYLFGMAAHFWSFTLCLEWYLTGRQWTRSYISRFSPYIHTTSWFLPSIQTLFVLVLSSVDGDISSGICYVGYRDPKVFLVLVHSPLIVLLLLGTLLLVAGFISRIRKRHVTRPENSGIPAALKCPGKPKDLRLGFFSLFHMVVLAGIVGCWVVEFRMRSPWERAKNCLHPCVSSSVSSDVSSSIRSSSINSGNSRESSSSSSSGSTRSNSARYRDLDPGVSSDQDRDPDLLDPHDIRVMFAISMCKHFLCLFLGVTSGLWLSSGMLVGAWKQVYRRAKTGREEGGVGAPGEGEAEARERVESRGIGDSRGVQENSCGRVVDRTTVRNGRRFVNLETIPVERDVTPAASSQTEISVDVAGQLY